MVQLLKDFGWFKNLLLCNNFVKQPTANQRHKCARHAMSRAIDHSKKYHFRALAGFCNMKPIKITRHNVFWPINNKWFKIVADGFMAWQNGILDGLGIFDAAFDVQVLLVDDFVVVGIFKRNGDIGSQAEQIIDVVLLVSVFVVALAGYHANGFVADGQRHV